MIFRENKGLSENYFTNFLDEKKIYGVAESYFVG